MKIVVIGGVAAGMSAASKARRMDKGAEIVVYEKGYHLSYGACGLPYYISGLNDDEKKLIARTQEDFHKLGIQTFLRHEVIKMIPENKQVLVRDIDNNTMFFDTYDKLMIAVGANTIIPSIKGIDLEGVHFLKTLEDGMLLKAAVNQPQIRDVVIIGGGYIGIEIADAMVELGKQVRVIEMTSGILTNFDGEISDLIAEELRDNDVELNLDEHVEEIAGQQKVEWVRTNKGLYKADLVIAAVGVRPATKFLENSGISLAKNGAIKIDKKMCTNIADIYAAGDCAQVYNRVLKQNIYIPLGTNANKCGRLAGANMMGANEEYVGTLGSAAIKVLGMEAARTGISEADAKRLDMNYTTAFAKTYDHPSYYPDATPIWIKLICEKSTKKILGAQAAGAKGVVLRIDIFAAAIHSEMTAPELGMTDLCYAPPFSGAWDAVNIACNAVK
ncbi:MAG: CoA-disulfide reductase [Clostridia bacterium]|nr:CoA-disulfide reductase [Clostridia bacterium]